MYFSEYELMFARYCKQRNIFSDKSFYNRKLDELIENVLFRKANSSDGEGCADLINFFEMIFSSKKEVKKYLSNVQLCHKNPNIVEIAEQILVEYEELKGNGSKDKSDKKLSETEKEIMFLKYSNLAKFALYSELSSSYRPGIELFRDSGKFKFYTREELVQCFESKNFYKISAANRIKLFQAVVDDYAHEHNARSMPIKFEKLPISKTTVCFGEFDASAEATIINSDIIDALDEIDPNKSQYLLYQILETLIHEQQHVIQYTQLEKQDKNDREELVSRAIMRPPTSLSFKSYLSELDEIDARCASFEYIRKIADEMNIAQLKEFYNIRKIEEQNNGKYEIPERFMEYFWDIYSPAMFNVSTNNIAEQKQEFNSVLSNMLEMGII